MITSRCPASSISREEIPFDRRNVARPISKYTKQSRHFCSPLRPPPPPTARELGVSVREPGGGVVERRAVAAGHSEGGGEPGPLRPPPAMHQEGLLARLEDVHERLELRTRHPYARRHRDVDLRRPEPDR